MKSGVSTKITELNCAEMFFQIAAEKPPSLDASSGLCIAVFHEPNTRYQTLVNCHGKRAQHTPSAKKKNGMAFPRVFAKQSSEVM